MWNVLSDTPFCVCIFLSFYSPQSECVQSHNFLCLPPLPVKSVECTQSHSFLCLHLFFFFFYSFQSECVQSHNFLSALFFFTLRKEWGMYSVTLLSVSASLFFFLLPPEVNVFSHTTFCVCPLLLPVKSVECTQSHSFLCLHLSFFLLPPK